MKIFLQYKEARGLRLFSLGRYQCEIWWMPPKFNMPLHTHNHEDVWVMFLAGESVFSKWNDKTWITKHRHVKTWRDSFKVYKTGAGESHYSVRLGNKSLWFVNFTKWISNTPRPTNVDTTLTITNYAK